MRSMRRAVVWSIVYLGAYIVASSLDLWTTEIALRTTRASEGNVFATDRGAYAAAKAWAITGIGAAIMVACVVFSALNAGKVATIWLEHPVRSFAKPYIFPWSGSVIDRSPLHLLCFAIAFVVLRLVAAGNNLTIRAVGVAPLGSFVKGVAARTSPIMGLLLVIGTLYVLLAIALSPFAARLIGAGRPPIVDH